MKQIKFKTLLLLLTLLLPATVSAYYFDFKVDGIYYEINYSNSDEVTVTSYDDNYYTESIIIPETVSWEGKTYTVTSIGERAFEYCNLTNITLPNSIQSIGESAFEGCSNLTDITIPNSVFDIGENAFEGTPWYNNQPDGVVYAGLVAYKYKGETENLNLSIALKEGTIGIADGAFSCCEFGNFTFPNSVMIIGDGAFGNCHLDMINNNTIINDSIYLPTSLISIGNGAFGYCRTRDYKFCLPNTLKTIGGYAFYGFIGLRSINIPNSVTFVGDYTFKDSSLREVTIDGIDSIPKGMFYNCRYLNKVTIPNTVTSIGSEAFVYASRDGNGLTINIPNSITYIGADAFRAAKFYSFSLSNSVTDIGSNAFSYTNLSSVTIPNSITEVGDWFVECKNLKNVIIPNSVTSIFGAFHGCTSLTNINLPNSLQVIGGGTFYGCTGLISIIIPNSVQTIGSNAFYHCTGLTNIIIPNSVTDIYEHAFAKCTNLENVLIGSGVKDIERWIFWNCDKLTRVTSLATTPPNYSHTESNYIFPESVYNQATLYVPEGSINSYQEAIDWKDFSKIQEIDYDVPVINFADDNVKVLCVQHWDNDGDSELSMEEAANVTNLNNFFSNNSTITSFDELQYFTGLSTINNGAFRNCISLSSIKLPDSITSIGDEAFKNCSKLTSMTIPNSVTSIGKMVFSGCSSMTSVTLSNSLSTISEGAFSGCKNLTSITIPNSVTQVDDMAFKDCTGLTKVNINDLAAWCRISFFNSYTSNPLRYARHLLLNDEEITNLEIPESIKEIKQWAFYACSGINSITIHKDVTSIADKAFLSCTGLTSVTCHAATPPSVGGNDVFTTSIIKNATLYVPRESVEMYSSKTPWKNFGNIVGIEETQELPGDTNGDGTVNIGDVNVIIEIILSGGTNAAADVNGDGVVNISDLNAIINIILGKH